MPKLRYIFIALWMLSCSVPASAQVSVSLGINLRSYPDFVVVPGYPVYYAPRLDENLFFYDGMYWIFIDDTWYQSTWYNGPWEMVDPFFVPEFVLRIPVRYYRRPPSFFMGWRHDAPPRWGDRWGRDWERRRGDWDRWDRRAAPAPAPLPLYQKRYSGDRYPRQAGQQQELRQRNYRYQPHDPVVRQQFQERLSQPEERVSRQREIERPAPRQERRPPPQPTEERGSRQQDFQRFAPQQEPRPQPPKKGAEDIQRLVAPPPQGRPEPQERRLTPQQEPREQQIQRPQGREERQSGREIKRESRGKDEEKNREERGRGRGE